MNHRHHEAWTLGADLVDQGRPRLLVIDNYDSFTYNLVQMLAMQRVALEVVRNDQLSVRDVSELAQTGHIQGLILSPGPGRPEAAGICVELLQARIDIPILGVCLGHQAMGYSDSAVIERAAVLMHGKTSQIRYDEHAMFEALPQPFVATRYHSLCIREETLSEQWTALAWSEDDTLMAMVHTSLPYWGFQFHPESILTAEGSQLLSNFVRLVESHSELLLDRPLTTQRQQEECY